METDENERTAKFDDERGWNAQRSTTGDDIRVDDATELNDELTARLASPFGNIYSRFDCCALQRIQ